MLVRWSLSLPGSLGNAWHAVGTESLISKVELCIEEIAVLQIIKDTFNSML